MVSTYFAQWHSLLGGFHSLDLNPESHSSESYIVPPKLKSLTTIRPGRLCTNKVMTLFLLSNEINDLRLTCDKTLILKPGASPIRAFPLFSWLPIANTS